jgi:hypothetical protein
MSDTIKQFVRILLNTEALFLCPKSYCARKPSVLRRPIRSAMKPVTVLKIVEQRSPPVKMRPICQRGSPIRLR